MLKTYFKREHTRTHYYAGAAGPYLDAFLQWLEQRGYRQDTIRRRLCGAVQLTAWADQAGKQISELDPAALKAFGDYLAGRSQLTYPSGNHTVRFQGAQHFLTFLQAQGRVPTATAGSVMPSPGLLIEFQHWMRAQRGVTEPTLRNYRPILLDLLKTLGDQAEQFTAEGLRRFVLEQARCHGKGRAKTVVTAVRMFLRFLIAMGRCNPGLDNAIPTIAQWRLASLPRYLPAEDIERILAVCHDTTPLGARDKAMLLLMARLGWRAGEVAGLRLTDIDWQDGTLVVMGKNRRETRLPLPQEVGDALLHIWNRSGHRCGALKCSSPRVRC